MAIRNFIFPGTYSRIEYVSYSAQRKQLSLQFAVYADPECEVYYFSIPVSFQGSGNALVIDQLIQNQTVANQIPDWPGLGVGTKVFLRITDETLLENDILAKLNNKVVEKNSDGTLTFYNPTYLQWNDQIWKRQAAGNYVVIETVETAQQFDEVFSSNNILLDAYNYLKERPWLAGTVDEP